VRLRKVGASALFWSGIPYRDLRQSPPKTLGRPSGRVKASAYHSAYHRRQIPVKMWSACLETALLSSSGGRDRWTEPRRDTWSGRTKAFSRDIARSLRPASMARCTGSSGGFASYRRDPLLGTCREGGLVIRFGQSTAYEAGPEPWLLDLGCRLLRVSLLHQVCCRQQPGCLHMYDGVQLAHLRRHHEPVRETK
jgi:hypothetical protein